ncbi:MAG TPA: cell wall-binding repeat-containing protein, partial [Candidatus Sulfotelmatobacter sp.]|nr:cell wall-binding repeat-containing protein [Candidatus Sulfotelmatobacter sp.]
SGLVDPVAVAGTGGQDEALVVTGLSVFRIQGTVASTLTMTSDPIGPFYVAAWSAAILDGTDLWLLSNQCQSDPGVSPPSVACLQVNEVGGLDTATPTTLQMIDAPRGAYDGEIGVAADGTLFLVYSQDLPGFAAGGAVYVTIHRTGDPFGLLRPRSLVVQAGYGPYPTSTASALPPDPTDPHAVWQATKADDVADAGWTTWTSKLKGDTDGAPAGTVAFPPEPQPSIFLDRAFVPVPAPGAGETYMRVSDSPTFAAAVSLPIVPVLPWSMDDQAAGGSKATGLRTVYVQFGDGLGDWSATATATVSLDASIPDTRMAGADRYETAADLSRDTFLPGVPLAFIASGLNYPDGMAGGAVAGEFGAPLLFVGQTMPAATLAELQRLQPGTIVILGGPGVVSTALEDQLRTLATTGTVHRLFGSDRYATAAAISAWAYPTGAPVALIAYGANFPDALAAGPPAGLFGYPILYAGKTAPAATMNEIKRLQPQYIIVLGGPANIPDSVALQLATASVDNIAYRLAGSDRYGTAAAIDAWAFPYGSDGAFVASALNFPDALAASAVAAWTGHPIVYTGNGVPAATASIIAALGPQQFWIMGSTGAVSASVVNALNANLAP